MKEEFSVNNELVISNDLIIVAYFMKENGWDGANKSNFQRVLYFSAALSPIFIPQYNWNYIFTNTFFGPYNEKIKNELEKLSVKGILELTERKVYTNRVEERYVITRKGINWCEGTLFRLQPEQPKVNWFKIIIKVLSIYGEEFLSKLIKEDPNIYSQNEINKYAKINTDNSNDNLSKEFFEFLKEKGKGKLNIESQKDEDYLLLFFDILYRKYKGGNK